MGGGDQLELLPTTHSITIQRGGGIVVFGGADVGGVVAGGDVVGGDVTGGPVVGGVVGGTGGMYVTGGVPPAGGVAGPVTGGAVPVTGLGTFPRPAGSFAGESLQTHWLPFQ